MFSNSNVGVVVHKNYVPLKVDCTKETDLCAEMVERYKVIGWPTLLFLEEDGSEIAESRLVGRLLDSVEFLDYLKKVE